MGRREVSREELFAMAWERPFENPSRPNSTPQIDRQPLASSTSVQSESLAICAPSLIERSLS
jgi:hypothetical protein